MKEIKSIEEFNDIINNELSIINVKTTTCTVCTAVSAQLEKLLKEYDIEPYAIYSDKVTEFAGQHLVFTVPTILIFNEGQEILRESRFIDYKKITRLLDMFLS